MLSVGVVLAFAIILPQTSFDLPFLKPDSNQQLLAFASLSVLIFLLFVALTFVLARNLLKLLAERRLGLPGSKFRTRLVVASLLLSFLPTIIMFWFSYGLMNRSIDKWFSSPVEEVRQETAEMASLLAVYAAQNARAEAQSIADSSHDAFANQDKRGLHDLLQQHQRTLQGGFAVALQNGEPAATLNTPVAWSELATKIPAKSPDTNTPATFLWGQTQYQLGRATSQNGGMILVAMPLPPTFSALVNKVEASQQRYLELNHERRLLRRTYMDLLLLLTVLVLFATTWLALFLSKLVTRPVTALAVATQEISRGNLDHRVEVAATDEIGDLVLSFNRMAEELQSSRKQIDVSNRELPSSAAAILRRSWKVFPPGFSHSTPLGA